MAALVRGWRVGCRLFSVSVLQRSAPLVKAHIPAVPFRVYSSTSKKVNQSQYVTGKRTEVDEQRVKEIREEGLKDPSLTDPNDPSYVSHGFHDDPHIDLLSYRMIFFVGISIMMVIAPLYVHYLPERNGRIWARRQAEMVIEERRKKGLPLISAEFCDLEKLVLPSDEEEERAWATFNG